MILRFCTLLARADGVGSCSAFLYWNMPLYVMRGGHGIALAERKT